MNSSKGLRARGLSIPAVALIALIGAALAIATSGGHGTHASEAHASEVHQHASKAHALTARQVKFHDGMRKLWTSSALSS